MALPLPTRRPPDDTFERIAAQLESQGWSVCPDFLPPAAVAALAATLRAEWGAGGFRPAGIGAGPARLLRPDIRCDRVRWLGDEPRCAAEGPYFTAMEGLRLAINRRLLQGLFSLEAHMTVYPPGSFYRRHVDRFRDAPQRRVSAILYLNDGWRAADGGELRLYIDDNGRERSLDILPRGGTLVSFLSERFPHEVLPARRERLSVTGWYRTREALPGA